MRIDPRGPVSQEWSGQETEQTATVQSGESSLAQVASRLGVDVEDLQNANPQITNPNALSPGVEIRLPQGTTGNMLAGHGDSDRGTGPATSQRMESDLDASAMRAILSSASAGYASSALPADGGAYGSVGGIAQEPPVVGPPGTEGYSNEVKQQLKEGLTKVYQSPQFGRLNAEEKDTVLKTLASNPPLTQEKIGKTLDLLESAKNLSPGDRKLALEGFRKAHADPEYAANLKKLIDDPKFKALSGAGQTAVLSQAKNYPDARTVGNLDRLLQKDWFTAQPLDEQQKSLKTIARFSHNPDGDRKIIDNTLDKFIGEKGDFKLVWKQYPPGSRTYGEGGDKTLFLNKDMIHAGNDPIDEKDPDARRLSLNTVAHEVNHNLNGDTVENNFKYFNAEYRAWYVGFQAEHGHPPSNQEALNRVRDLFDADAYEPSTSAALADPDEAKQIFDFLKQLTGLDVNAGNVRHIVFHTDPEKDWKTLSVWPAPVPTGNNDNH